MRGLKRLFPVSKMAILGIYVSKEVSFFRGEICGFSIQGIFLQDFEKQLKKSVTPRDLLRKYGKKSAKNCPSPHRFGWNKAGYFFAKPFPVRISPRYEAVIPFGGR